jgi:hypothetical protein
MGSGSRALVEGNSCLKNGCSSDSESFQCYLNRMLQEELGFGYDRKEKLYRKTKVEIREFITVEIRHIGSNCLKIVEHACNESKKFYKIYCVFDELKNPGDTSFKKAMNLEIQNNLTRIYSVPSYEFWLLLHFSNSSAQYINNDRLIKALEAAVQNKCNKKDFKYNKSGFSDDLFILLQERLPDAIKNAKILEISNTKTGSKNPSTKIYRLIEDFQNL